MIAEPVMQQSQPGWRSADRHLKLANGLEPIASFHQPGDDTEPDPPPPAAPAARPWPRVFPAL